MRARSVLILSLCLSLLCSSPRPLAAGELITVTNGPEGGWTVSTPNDDFLVIPEGDGVYWVGTQAEYDKGVAKAWAAQHGFREAHIMGEQGAAVFVPTATLKASLPGVTVDDVVVTIQFGAVAALPKSQRTVNVYWNQDNATRVAMILADVRTKTGYPPYDAFNDQGYLNEDFAIPFASLRDPMVLLFVIKGHKGAAIAVKSLAWAHYNVLKQTVDQLTEENIAVTREQIATLGYLKIVDPSIANGKPKTTSASSAAIPATAQPSHSVLPTPELPVASSPSPAVALQDANLVGTWRGFVYERTGAMGSFTITFALDPTGITGRWFADYGSAGSGGGTIFNYQRLNAQTLSFEIPGHIAGCSKLVTLSLDNAGTMTGSYAMIQANCQQVSGRFSLSKVHQP